uniref:Uncharacterized protein n=1 Tax=Glossina austeni TaxID=7395 RepID=A0A1A9UHN7_GLOAU
MNVKPTIKTSDSKDLSTNVRQTNFQNYYLAAIVVVVVVVLVVVEVVVVVVVSYATSILVSRGKSPCKSKNVVYSVKEADALSDSRAIRLEGGTVHLPFKDVSIRARRFFPLLYRNSSKFFYKMSA